MWPPQKKTSFRLRSGSFLQHAIFVAKDLIPSLESFVWICGRKIMGKTPINRIIQSIPTHDFVDDWIILDYIVDWSFSYDLFKG